MCHPPPVGPAIRPRRRPPPIAAPPAGDGLAGRRRHCRSSMAAPSGRLFESAVVDGASRWLRSPRIWLGAAALASWRPWRRPRSRCHARRLTPHRRAGSGTAACDRRPPSASCGPGPAWSRRSTSRRMWPRSWHPASGRRGCRTRRSRWGPQRPSSTPGTTCSRAHHRSSYRTAAGHCYDVRDDTIDQLYRPERARITQKQIDALAATWSLSLRKKGRFFLTGYRAGADVGCARDTDGWRLYAASVERCAKQGWSRQRIQEAYYAPRIAFVWDTPPLLIAGAQQESPGPHRDRARRHAAEAIRCWAAPSAPSAGAAPMLGAASTAYLVQRRVEDGPWTDLALPKPRTPELTVALDPERRRGVPRPGPRPGRQPQPVGLVGRGAARGPAVRRRPPGGAMGPRGGSWCLGRDLHRARTRGERVSLRFTGRAVAIVAPTGPHQGRVRVRVGGRVVARWTWRDCPRAIGG